MSLKSAIESAQAKVVEAYAAISEKGGTLPTTQNLANLPQAIADLQGGCGAYDYLKELGVPDSYLVLPNETKEKEIEDSKLGDDNSTMVYVDDITNNLYYYDAPNCNREIVIANTWKGATYQPFFNQYSLHTVIVGDGTYEVGNVREYCFYNCFSLRNIYAIFNCNGGVPNINSGFRNVYGMREIRFKNVGGSLNISHWAGLSYESLLYIVTNLSNVSGNTLTLGAKNIAKLNATTEGAAAISSAQEMGWTIA